MVLLLPSDNWHGRAKNDEEYGERDDCERGFF